MSIEIKMLNRFANCLSEYIQTSKRFNVRFKNNRDDLWNVKAEYIANRWTKLFIFTNHLAGSDERKKKSANAFNHRIYQKICTENMAYIAHSAQNKYINVNSMVHCTYMSTKSVVNKCKMCSFTIYNCANMANSPYACWYI